MKYLRLILFSLFSLLLSCKSKEEPELFPGSISFNIEEVEHLHLTGGRQLQIYPALRISEIAFHDTLLILTGESVANEYRLHIHNALSGEHLSSFAREGRGPGEFLYVRSVQLLEKRRELYFHDLNLRIGVVYSLDSLLSESISPSEIVRFEKPAYTMYLRIDSANYLCGPRTHDFIGLEPSYMLYQIYNTNLDVFFYRVSLPPLDGIDSVFNRGHLSSLFSTSPAWVNYNEHTGFIVQPYTNFDLIEVYDYNDAMQRIVRIHGPDRFFPYFEFTTPATSFAGLNNPDQQTWLVARDPSDRIVYPWGVSRYGYFRARAFNDGFYIIYCGQPRPETGIDPAEYLKRSLFFFRYDGTPIRRYTFDVVFRQEYAVDHHRGVIYILGLDGEIYAYEIP
jgi:hypothetical protein